MRNKIFFAFKKVFFQRIIVLECPTSGVEGRILQTMVEQCLPIPDQRAPPIEYDSNGNVGRNERLKRLARLETRDPL